MTAKQKQCLLAYLGYYTLEIDGNWGPASQEATLDFQRTTSGLARDGVYGNETHKAVISAVANGKFKKIAAKAETSGDFWDEIEYFDRDEFRCTCNGKYCNGFPVEPDENMVRIVDQIRKHFGKPFTPNSSVRCKKRNAEVDGASNSQHLYGTAADISVPGVSPKAVAKYAETLLPNTGGIGIYPWGIHVDVRSVKARWNG